MTTIKISQLPDATTPLTGNEVIPLDQNGITKKAPAACFELNWADLSMLNVAYAQLVS
jgi:hypothetical protein